MGFDFGEVPQRFSVLMTCYKSEPGQEPTAAEHPFRLNPEDQAIKLRTPAAPSTGSPASSSKEAR